MTYTYDLAGRVSTRTDGTGTTSLSWRFDGSPLTEDGAAAGRHLRRAYDASGRLLRLESSWGTQLDAVSTTGSDQVSPATTYTANSLNQYDAITRPQSFDVTGKRTSTSATITVNGVSLPTSGYQPNGNGLHFRKEVANTPAASLNGDIYAALPGDIFEPVTVSQTINGTTTDLTNDPIQFVPPSVTASPCRKATA